MRLYFFAKNFTAIIAGAYANSIRRVQRVLLRGSMPLRVISAETGAGNSLVDGGKVTRLGTAARGEANLASCGSH